MCMAIFPRFRSGFVYEVSNILKQISDYYNHNFKTKKIYVFVVYGQLRREDIFASYNLLFLNSQTLIQRFQRIQRRINELDQEGLGIYHRTLEDVVELRESVYEKREKFVNYSFITGFRLKKHKRYVTELNDERNFALAGVNWLERFLSEKYSKVPRGQKFIPVIDPYGEENWEE